MPKMTDDTLNSFLDAEKSASLGFMYGDLSRDRERAIEFYNGAVDVAAPEGRSDVVSTDVRDAVDGMLPDLLDVFLSSDEVVKFEPQGQEDEAAAKQMTDAANYVFYKQNNGALILHDWIKASLMEKTCAVKFYYEDYQPRSAETYEKLSDEEFQMLIQGKAEIIAHEAFPDPDRPGASVHDVRIMPPKHGKICIEGIPSEEFLVCADQRSLCLQDTRFAAHRRRLTLSDVREMGYDVPDDIASDEENVIDSPEGNARRRYYEEREYDSKGGSVDPSQRKVTFEDISCLADWDGDGIAERRRIHRIGKTVLLNDDSDHVPFAAICPVIMPYRFEGLSIADLVIDIQRSKTQLKRGMYDSLFLAINPRTGVHEAMTNLDDLLVSRPGGIVRFKTNPSIAMQQMETKFVGQQAFPMLEYEDTVKESRTGFTRYSQGMDADSLNKTATGVSLITQSSAKRMKLIARMIAETGMKDLFRGVITLFAKHNQRSMMIRLRNQWIPVDPRQWKTGYDMSVNVGLGTGDKTQQAAALQQLMTIQGAMRQGGLGHLAQDTNVYNAAKRYAESIGFKQEGEMFTPPGQNNPPQQQKPPEVAAKEMELQAEQQKTQFEAAQEQKKKAAEIQNAQVLAKIQAETSIAVAQINAQKDKEIAELKMQHEQALARLQGEQEAQHRIFEANSTRDLEDRKRQNAPMEMTTKDGSVKLPSATDYAEAMQAAFAPVLQQMQAAAQAATQAAQAFVAEKELVRDQQGNITGSRVKANGRTH